MYSDDRLSLKEKFGIAIAALVFVIGMCVYLNALHNREMRLLEMDLHLTTEENTSLEWSE